ncbi:tryptophan halogenase family protein [Brunnivagina elsteri]|uniref:Tryptophan halogenase n=1 Tax=Brunnivagina elsteri CCALA 953 TaxID=987040 RepID=A0A2A2TE42_9CYAN|nr:tryptophan halogenase family protein [Calothrix elsteri]PAX52067.1 tryptophan halogenase [Calothrix elsteri CCALA 953]
MKNTGNKIENIVIVGGGTTGWMAAAYLVKALQGSVAITLIESDQIPTLGVGEATVPSIRTEFFDFLEIPESEWMPQCNGTFKIGIKYADWSYTPHTTKNNEFYHIFGESKKYDDIPLTHYWLKKRLDGYDLSMSDCCYSSTAVCEFNKSPKFLDGTTGVNYAYHFDANLLAKFLASWTVKKGVVRVVDKVVNVILDNTGAIDFLKTEKGNTHKADLYIDCSGFQGLLINQALKEPFISYSDSLLCDAAVAIPVKTDNIDGLRPYTIATALSSGWSWEIPLYGRLGRGYVYSQKFISPDEAEQELRKFHGSIADDIPAKHLKMRVGRNEHSWVKNCVSLGIASGFIEPLESTGIYFIYAALKHLIRYFPDKSMNPALKDKYNERIAFMVDDVRDFIVLHYCTTHREDTPFWKANKFDLKIPDTLKRLLEVYQAGAPINLPYTDEGGYNNVFDAGFDRFWTNSNYMAILGGMNHLPNSASPILNHKPESVNKAEKIFKAIKDNTKNLLDELPSHYEYIKNLYLNQKSSDEIYSYTSVKKNEIREIDSWLKVKVS